MIVKEFCWTNKMKAMRFILVSISMACFMMSMLLFTLKVLVPTTERIHLNKIIKRRFSEDTPTNINWHNIFGFLPLGDPPCDGLYGQVKLEDLYPRELRQARDLLQDHLKEVLQSYGLGLDRIAGYSAQYHKQYITMWNIGTKSQHFVNTVCETGFNVGHSSLVWLMSNHNAKVYSFDLGKHNYSRFMADYLTHLFPGRLEVTWGDSLSTLPNFRETFPEVTCDLIFIDGGHYKDEAYSDWLNFRQIANKNAIIIVDNYPDVRFDSLGTFWEDAKHDGEIMEIFRCHYSRLPQGFSVGRLNLDCKT